MKASRKKIPKFKSESAEAEFWARNDATDYLNFAKAKPLAFPKLKPTTRMISIRLPDALLWRLKTLANERDIPYQSLIKQFLFDRVKDEAAADRRA